MITTGKYALESESGLFIKSNDEMSKLVSDTMNKSIENIPIDRDGWRRCYIGSVEVFRFKETVIDALPEDEAAVLAELLDDYTCAHDKLCEYWEDDKGSKIFESLTTFYPFDKCFRELYAEVFAWACEVKQTIGKL